MSNSHGLFCVTFRGFSFRRDSRKITGNDINFVSKKLGVKPDRFAEALEKLNSTDIWPKEEAFFGYNVTSHTIIVKYSEAVSLGILHLFRETNNIQVEIIEDELNKFNKYLKVNGFYIKKTNRARVFFEFDDLEILSDWVNCGAELEWKLSSIKFPIKNMRELEAVMIKLLKEKKGRTYRVVKTHTLGIDVGETLNPTDLSPCEAVLFSSSGECSNGCTVFSCKGSVLGFCINSLLSDSIIEEVSDSPANS